MGQQDTQTWSSLAERLDRPDLAGLDIDCLAVGLATRQSTAVRIDDILFLHGELHEEPKTLQSHCASLIAIWGAMQTPTLIDLGHCGCVGRKMLRLEPRHGRRFAIHAQHRGEDPLLFVVFSSTRPWSDAEVVKRLAQELVDAAARTLQAAQPAPSYSLLTPVPAPVVDWYQFTAREIDILKLIADGLSNKQIAKQLGSSPNTVRNQIHAVFRKTGANNRTELAMRTMSQLDQLERAASALRGN